MPSSEGVRYVLVADHTLMSNYRFLPLGYFMSCIPSDVAVSRLVHMLLAPITPHRGGRAVLAPSGLRKVEASLARDLGRESVVVAHPEHVRRFVGPGTEVVGVHTMDPFGLGPVSMMFTSGQEYRPFTQWGFEGMVATLPRDGFRLAVGGPGTWQFEHRPGALEDWGIDTVLVGETDHNAGQVFADIAEGSMAGIVRTESVPSAEEIPANLGGTVLGLVEVMRGCGRGCRFCQPTLRMARYLPHGTVRQDLTTNARSGMHHCWVLSDDIFMYKLEDHREVRPNHDAIVELFRLISGTEGVRTIDPTHGSLAPIVADPELIADLTELIRPVYPNGWIGLQPGLETGSPRIIRDQMPRKTLPFSPEEWPDVVSEAVTVLNRHRWYPAMTLMLGVPGEEGEDLDETLDLLRRLEREADERNGRFVVAPLSFVPTGALTGENMYNVADEVTEGQMKVIYHCWRHITKAIRQDIDAFMAVPPGVRGTLNVVSKLGSRYILRSIERYASRQGFEVGT